MGTAPLSHLTNIVTLLPGPGRKKLPRPYRYRLTFLTPDPDASGCVMIWEVLGGEVPYQIALERQETGSLRMHCTCADSNYRGETAGHTCKHVRGLLDFGRPTYPVPQVVAASA